VPSRLTRGILAAVSEWPQVAFEDAPVKIVDGDRGKHYPRRSDFVKMRHCLFLNTGNVTTALAQLPDTLLPKLISGELRVPDSESIVARLM
jgi:hypothetical protein